MKKLRRVWNVLVARVIISGLYNLSEMCDAAGTAFSKAAFKARGLFWNPVE